MATILAFAGSNSSTSINFQLVRHSARMIEGHELRLVDLSEFPFPQYSEDREAEFGFPEALEAFYKEIREADGILLSVNEHNGNPSSYFKNLIDWLSRIDKKFLEDKKLMLMSASPGKRGAMGAREVIERLFPRFGARIVATFSLPSFKAHFEEGTGITQESLASEHQQALQQFLQELS